MNLQCEKTVEKIWWFGYNKEKGVFTMLRRYELTDEEWLRIEPLLPPENTGKQGRPRKDNRIIMNGIVWLARSGAPWRDLPERYGSWKTVYSRFRKWIDDGILDNIFRILSLEAELEELSIDASIIQAHQHSAGAKKRGPSNEIGHSRGGASTKIHAAVDAYGYPVYLMINEGQRNDINYAIPLLDQIEINGSNVLADRGYDSNKLLDYVYARGGEPTIPSRKGAKFERHCDWWLYKERHLVEKYFLKLKAFRRIATRYDKLAATYLGFICIASILIWLK